MFTNIESFFKGLQSCLDLLQEFINQSKTNKFALPDKISDKTTKVWQKTQDGFVLLLEERREFHQIDTKLAAERDRMIVEGGDEIDEE